MCIRDRPGGAGSSITGSTSSMVEAGGTDMDTLYNFPAESTAGTPISSGIGILRKMSSSVLKLQIEALEVRGLGKTISNPKLFTLDNQVATIKQGVQLPVAGSGDTAPSFKDAALKLTVTPSIIGDGNVLLQIQVNNDSPDRKDPSAVGINTMEISTKLLIADGDIVVIGGIKKNQITNQNKQVPGMSKLPVIGKMFKGESKTDSMNELLVFIAVSYTHLTLPTNA